MDTSSNASKNAVKAECGGTKSVADATRRENDGTLLRNDAGAIVSWVTAQTARAEWWNNGHAAAAKAVLLCTICQATEWAQKRSIAKIWWAIVHPSFLDLND